MKHAATYFHIFKKHHQQDLPKTNYDLAKEEQANLGMLERQLIGVLNKQFTEFLQ